MLVKYYLSDNINAPFENFALGLKTLEMALIYIYIYKFDSYNGKGELNHGHFH